MKRLEVVLDQLLPVRPVDLAQRVQPSSGGSRRTFNRRTRAQKSLNHIKQQQEAEKGDSETLNNLNLFDDSEQRVFWLHVNPQTNWEGWTSLTPAGAHRRKHTAGLECCSWKQMFGALVALERHPFTAWHWFPTSGPPAGPRWSRLVNWEDWCISRTLSAAMVLLVPGSCSGSANSSSALA